MLLSGAASPAGNTSALSPAVAVLLPVRPGRRPFDRSSVCISWRAGLPETAPASGLAAVDRPDEHWWDQVQEAVDGGIGQAAEDLVAEQPPPPLSTEQRRALWSALAPAADRAADAETGSE